MNRLIKIAFLLSFCLPLAAEAATITAAPAIILQGEPLKITIEGLKLEDIESLTFDGQSVTPFFFTSTPAAFVGINLNKLPGTYKMVLTQKNGTSISKEIIISARPKIEAPLGIPQKLGGNTPQAATNLVNKLAVENAILNSLWTNPKKLWTTDFLFPLKEIKVTDSYGYSRETGQYNIAHKGTDFRAIEGTKVYTMNRGVVRLARKMTVYGNTIVVDHGQGIMTFYMHLSKMSVSEGQLVQQGDLIGRSGQTGYAESPHLHLSVRLNNTSIDPMKFLDFFTLTSL